VPRTLPLLVVTAMLGIAMAIEAAGFGAVAWETKLPLAALLVAALARSIGRRASRTERDRS
jgi:hypothetical protein